MTDDELRSLLEASGASATPLSREERADALERWSSVYGWATFRRTGRMRPGRGCFHWHAFSFDDVPSRQGEMAHALYRLERPPAYLVIPEHAARHSFACRGGTLPDLLPLVEDILVFPEDLSWTMAFTHEVSWHLGPYFARYDWCAPPWAPP